MARPRDPLTRLDIPSWPVYSPECRDKVDRLLRAGGSLSAYKANPDVGPEPYLGSWADRLERRAVNLSGYRYAVVVNSGTAALHVGLEALGVRGKEVITSPFTFSATVGAIVQAGGIPVFADIDERYFGLERKAVDSVLSRKTAAILPVSIFGCRSGLKALSGLPVPIVEDACQAAGVKYDGPKPLWSVWSFNGGKQVPAGEAGCFLTDSAALARKARLVMNHGENFGSDVGWNYRPNEVTCCIAWHGLDSLPQRQRQRLINVQALESFIAQDDYLTGRVCPFNYTEPHGYYVWPFDYWGHIGGHMSRQRFIKRMADRGVAVGLKYVDLTDKEKYPAFKRMKRTPMPNLRRVRNTLCFLSCVTSEASVDDMYRLSQAMKEALRV